MPEIDSRRGPASLVIVGLLIAGVFELGSILTGPFFEVDGESLVQLSGPATFLPVTLAVLLVSGRSGLTIATLAVASATLAARVAMLSVTIASSPVSWSEALWLCAGLLTGLAITGWALDKVVKRRIPAPVHQVPGPRSGGTPPERRTSPSTPNDTRWHTATTPWPRANESDPNGTLIRPPHREQLG